MGKLTKQERLRGRLEFCRMYKRGHLKKGPLFWLYYGCSPGETTASKLGISISSSLGLKAVARNRIKRLMREWFRLNKNRLKAGHVLLFVLKKMPASFKHQQINAGLEKVIMEAGLMREKEHE